VTGAQDMGGATVRKMTSVKLKYEWKYTVYGTHCKRYYEHPVEIKGVQKATFDVDEETSLKKQLEILKAKMIDTVKEYCRTVIHRKWEAEEIEEEIASEAVKIYNVREYNKWMDLEDM
jgi:hypothetical protein